MAENATFPGPHKVDAVIAIMGMTGSGKSTLIKLLSGDEGVKIGHGMRSMTQYVSAYICQYTPPGGKPLEIGLLDTPGFDDTDRSDTDVLQEISRELSEIYKGHRKLSGMIYIHGINEARLGGAANSNLRMFKKLCGTNAFKNVVLTTTKWDLEKTSTGIARENELLSVKEWWGDLASHGAQTYRHHNTEESALKLLGLILDRSVKEYPPVPLRIQEEMVENNCNLNETSAGQELDRKYEEQRQKHEQEQKQLREELLEAMREKDEENAKQIREEQAKAESRLRHLEDDRRKLQVSLDRMQEQREENQELKEALRESKQKQERLEQSNERSDRLQNQLEAQQRQTEELSRQIRLAEESRQQQRQVHDRETCTQHKRCRMYRKIFGSF